MTRPAIVAGNGERLWRRADAIQVVRRLDGTDVAVLGGEVYERHAVGWGTFLGQWDLEPPRDDAEPWLVFAHRSRSYVLERLAAEPVPAPHQSAAVGTRLYFLAQCTEADYSLSGGFASRGRDHPPGPPGT